MTRPSDSILNYIREVSRKSGYDTATLAEATGLGRNHLKKILSGQKAMTLDELIQISSTLEIDEAHVDALGLSSSNHRGGGSKTSLNEAGDGRVELWMESPSVETASRMARFGFSLGSNIVLLLDTAALKSSGIPAFVLAQNPGLIRIDLDAAYHHENRPAFEAGGLHVRLSFDAVYTCLLPWSAFVRIGLSSQPIEPPTNEEREPDPPTEQGPPHLRLVD